MNYTGNFG
jgi:hypothetical protein